MSETILNKLREEHREINHMMSQILSTEDVLRRKELYLSLKELFVPHMEGEERTIYFHLREDVNEEEAAEVAENAEFEHQEIKDLLAKLDNISIESDEWESTFRKLETLTKKHVEEEETMLFAEAKQDFSKEELIEFEEEFEEVKHSISL